VSILTYLVSTGQLRVARDGLLQLPGGRPFVIQRGTDIALPLSAPPAG
jgi:hypothetical protein